MESKHEVVVRQFNETFSRFFQITFKRRQEILQPIVTSVITSESAVLLFELLSNALKNDGRTAALPESLEVSSHLLDYGTIVCGGIGVHHIEDPLFGNYQAVPEALPFWSMA